jgi:hypothetical protein
MRRRTTNIAVLVALALFAFGVPALLALMLTGAFGGPAYRLVLQPAGQEAVVRFRWPEKGFASPPFRVPVEIPARQVIVLDADNVAIPHGKVEFADRTTAPGRFKIRVGETLFDVSEARIRVDGKLYDWQAE